MRSMRIIVYVGLAVAWLSFALWQYRDYVHQHGLIEETLLQQSRSIMTALVGGMKSHRRLGRYFEDQLQGMLDELIQSEDVLSVVVRSADGSVVLSAQDRIPESEATEQSASLATEASPRVPFELTETLDLSPDQPGPGSLSGPGRGGGLGLGRGRGFGGRRWEDESAGEGPFATGGRFQVTLLLDRHRADIFQRRMTWSHVFVTSAAGLVALSIALAWRASMHLAQVNTRAQLQEAEMRHLRDLSQAAAGLAHETRNPLGLIRGWTQRLGDTTLSSDERAQHSHTIMEECDRVTARINQFLAFARPRSLDLRPVDAERLLAELSAIMQPDLEAHELTMVVHVDRRVRWLRADLEQFRQVVFNLLQNATHFAPPRSAVAVTVAAAGVGRAVCQVRDCGPGVPVDAIESLFTPYFTTRPEGTGLGLAIVRHIATMHHWTASYRPHSDGGSIFEIGNIHAAEQPDHFDRGR